MTKRFILFTFFMFSVIILGQAQNETFPVARFSEMKSLKDLEQNWHPLKFPNIDIRTKYSVSAHPHDRSYLTAKSERSASALIRDLNLPAEEFPLLKWRWKAEELLEKSDTSTKTGDDHILRLYLFFSPDQDFGSKSLRKKAKTMFKFTQRKMYALTYIWAKDSSVGQIASNPYSKKFKQVVVRSGPEYLNQWVTEERNIIQDYETAYGKKPKQIVAAMLMTDTDNTNDSVVSYYGDIFLEKLPQTSS